MPSGNQVSGEAQRHMDGKVATGATYPSADGDYPPPPTVKGKVVITEMRTLDGGTLLGYRYSIAGYSVYADTLELADDDEQPLPHA